MQKLTLTLVLAFIGATASFAVAQKASNLPPNPKYCNPGNRYCGIFDAHAKSLSLYRATLDGRVW